MKVIIGQGSCGIASGAKKTEAEFRKQIKDKKIKAEVGITGCVGMCYLEPIVDIYDNGNNLTRLVKVSPDDAKAIADYVSNGNTAAVEKLMVSDEDKAFLAKQTRIALRN